MRFFAHSVIEIENGELIDFAPGQPPWEYLFLKHDQVDGGFAEIVERGGWCTLISKGDNKPLLKRDAAIKLPSTGRNWVSPQAVVRLKQGGRNCRGNRLLFHQVLMRR